ncbi:MAG: Nif11-like leader peptide family natural product precursor [Coriobacteriia bacterium]|nr:Nif11-like leader peptide family natural product precursor [Coriobacteriia bacterium]
MDFKDIPDDIKKRVEACKNPEELLELAKEQGYKLSEAELEAISGGVWTTPDNCTLRRGLCNQLY